MATVHRATPTLTALDPRGLVVRSVAYCRSTAEGPADVRIHRTEHDRAGWAVALWDPRLLADPSAPANLATLYSLRGHVLGTESVDAGWRRNLWGAAQQWMNAWDGRGTLRRNAFDLRLRPLAVFEQGGCTERYRYGDGTFPRNQRGQLIRHDDPAGTVLFTEYGVAGQALQHIRRFLQALDAPDWPEALAQRDALLEPAPGATSHTRFNAMAEVVEQTDAKGHRQLFSHTPSGQLRQVQLQLAGQGHRQTLVSAIRYDAQGRTEQETAGNGVVTTLTYRAEDGRLIRLHAAGPQVLQNLHYAYDPVGNVLSIEDQAQPVRYHANQRIDPVNRYTYDSLYQLIQATGWEAGAANKGPHFSPFADPAPRAHYRQTYAYDASGNLLTLAHQGPQSHGRILTAAQHSNRCLPQRNGQPPTEAEIAAAFDANGNLLELHPGQTLAWDRRNQLQEVQPVQRDSAPDDSERYLYGGDGLRVRKVQSSQTHARTVTREVRYLLGLEIRTRPSETLHVIVVQAGRNSVRVLHWETPPPVANDQIRYSASDHLGSCTLELDSAGAVISHETYHPLGTTAWFAGRSEVEARYKTVRYSNKERDATGLYYYGFRYYMPWLQRWVNPDPAGNIDGLNFYRMVRNSPIMDVDLKGLAPSRVLRWLKRTFTTSESESTPVPAPAENAPVFDRAVYALAQRFSKTTRQEDFEKFAASVYGGVARQNVPVGGFLYRSHYEGAIEPVGLVRASGAESPHTQAFTRQLFEHSGMQADLSGKVLSFTPNLPVAKRFSQRPNSVLVRVDTRKVDVPFRAMANIIATDAEELIRTGVIRVPHLVNALGYVSQGEYETFYMGGDVPEGIVEIYSSGKWISIQEYLSVKRAVSNASVVV